jgi:hypothetical protein
MEIPVLVWDMHKVWKIILTNVSLFSISDYTFSTNRADVLPLFHHNDPV